MKGRIAVIVLGCFFSLIVMSRRPGTFVTPQFYAEDGAGFFQDAHNDGFFASILRPTAGYLNTVPRLIAGAALLAPLRLAPLVVAALALLVQMLPVFYLLGDRAAVLIPTWSGRVAAAAIYAVLPNADEIYVNATNTQWHLTLVTALLLLLPPPAGRVARTAELLLLAAAALTGPGSLLLLPVAFLLLRADCRNPWQRALTAVVTAGALVQLVLLVASQRVSAATIPGVGALTPRELAALLANHAFYSPLLGVARIGRLYEKFGLFHHVLALIGLALLAAVALRFRERLVLVLGYLALATVTLSLFFPSNDLHGWLQPRYGTRYYFYATLCIAAIAAHLVARRGGWRLLGVAVAAPMLTCAVPADFFLWTWQDTAYRDQVAHFQSLPPGARLFIETLPEGWGMFLVRKPGETPRPSPIASVPLETRHARGTLAPVDQNPAGSFIRVRGTARDPVSGGRAGGVLVIIDDRLFPANYGRAWHWGPADPDETAYQRLVPVSEIGPGLHQLSVLVFSPDRRRLFRLERDMKFTL